MLGNELREFGRLIDNQELMLVHIFLEAGKSVPAHDHKGQEVFFTLIKGAVTVKLNEVEDYPLVPGGVLNFAGEATVSVHATKDSEFFVYLINRCH